MSQVIRDSGGIGCSSDDKYMILIHGRISEKDWWCLDGRQFSKRERLDGWRWRRDGKRSNWEIDLEV